MDIPYHDTVQILGFQIKSTVWESALDSWTKMTAKIWSQAQEDYYWMLTLDKRIQFVHEDLLECAWYMSQIKPLPDVCVWQLNTLISWFIWKGDIFCVPLSTLYRPKDDRCWDLTIMSPKSHALLIYRMQQQVMNTGTITAAWMRIWGLKEQGSNPPFRDVIPENLEYVAFCDGLSVCGYTRIYGIQTCIQKKIIQYFISHQ